MKTLLQTRESQYHNSRVRGCVVSTCRLFVFFIEIVGSNSIRPVSDNLIARVYGGSRPHRVKIWDQKSSSLPSLARSFLIINIGCTQVFEECLLVVLERVATQRLGGDKYYETLRNYQRGDDKPQFNTTCKMCRQTTECCQLRLYSIHQTAATSR